MQHTVQLIYSCHVVSPPSTIVYVSYTACAMADLVLTDLVLAELADEARVEDDDEERRDDAGDERVDGGHGRHDVVVAGPRRAHGRRPETERVVGEDGVGVDDEGEGDEAGDDDGGAPLRAERVSAQRVEDIHVALHREADDAPRGQEATGVRHEHHHLGRTDTHSLSSPSSSSSLL